MTGNRVADVDSRGSYQPTGPSDRAFKTVYQLVRNSKEQWRINGLPSDLILIQDEFERKFRPSNLYYFATNAGGKLLTGEGRTPRLVPDQVYLPRRDDLTRAALRALAKGPSKWLSPVVASAFPKGAVVQSSSLDEAGTLRVVLKGRVLGGERSRCELIAAQVLRSAGAQGSGQGGGVRVEDRTGFGCRMKVPEADKYDAIAAGATGANVEYFVDGRGRVRELGTSSSSTNAPAVPGPLGDGSLSVRSVGVRRDSGMAAAVSSDGHKLYLAPLDRAGRMRRVLTSSAHEKGPDSGLTAPSWDGWNGMWVADGSRLLYVDKAGKQREAGVPQISRSSRISAVRVAADGARIVLLVRVDKHTVAMIGRVERGESAGRTGLAVRDLRELAPQLENVTAASWSGPSQLVVLGQERKGFPQMYSVDVDGSRPLSPKMSSVAGMKAVAASEEANRPLVVDSSDGVLYRLEVDGNRWKQITPKGSAPVYPG
jgi:hypothetical protein